MKTCRIDGCDNPRVEGAFLCLDHLSGKRRCEGRVRTYDEATGEILTDRQCKRSARQGNTTCQAHGATSPRAKASAAKAEALTAMQRFVQPYSGDIDPISAFEMEFRRTYGRILWLEEQIAGLEDEKALIWGLTKKESIGAAEFTGTNKTYEARIHVFEEMLRWERKHFLELEKTWIRANLDERKLNMMRDHITYTYTKVIEAVRMLGHDPTEPGVREQLMRLFGGGGEHDMAALER